MTSQSLQDGSGSGGGSRKDTSSSPKQAGKGQGSSGARQGCDIGVRKRQKTRVWDGIETTNRKAHSRQAVAAPIRIRAIDGLKRRRKKKMKKK
jgi:hypothetical protein